MMTAAILNARVAEIGGTLHGIWGHLELAGHSLAFVHGDDRELLHHLEHADAFDFLFHGHTHSTGEHRTGKTRVSIRGRCSVSPCERFACSICPAARWRA